MRWLFVLFNVLMGAVLPVELTYARAPGWPASGIMTAAYISLGIWAVVYYRRDGHGFLLDLAPFVFLTIGGIASGDGSFVLGRLVAALFLHSLYRPSIRRLVFLGTAYSVVGQGIAIAIGEPQEHPVSALAGLLLVFGMVYIMQAVASSMLRHIRQSRRNAALTATTASLLTERDPDRIAAVVAEGIRDLSDDPSATASVWREDHGLFTLAATAGATSPPLSRVALADFSPQIQDAYRRGETVVLGASELAALEDEFGVHGPWTSSVTVPIVTDGTACGAISLSARDELDGEVLDGEVLDVLRQVAYETSLALLLAERESLLTGIIDNSADLIAVVDDGGTLRFVSPALTTWTGLDPLTLQDRPLGELLDHPGTDLAATLDDLPLGAPVLMRLAAGAGNRREAPDGADVEVTSSRLPDGARVLNIRDVTERRRLEAEITHRAFHDSVTGLPNRARFLDALERTVQGQGQGTAQAGAAVALLDLDNFKVVNDTLGHAAGDQLLGEIAHRLTQATRGSDLAARLGGDEFALLLHDVDDADHVARVVERVLDELREPVDVDGRQLSVTASAGITIIDGDDKRDEVLRNADLAMYAAKEMGRDRYTLYHPGMHQEVVAYQQLRSELEAALDEGQLVVHYQPIIDLHAEEIVGVEALVRWHHPERGLLPPDEFIPVAEETGLIVPLGRWVLSEACHEVAGWMGSPDAAPPYLAVNLSPMELQSATLVDDVDRALRESGLQPAQLTLEITETALIGDTAAVSDVLVALRALGARIAIDDFGTGYSSISHLHRLPVDVIKIDREFVDIIGSSPDQAPLAEAIVKLAGTLDLHTVAEGVEHRDQRSALSSWGCTHAQGWLWAPARTAEETRALFQSGVRRVAGDAEMPHT